MDIQELLQKPNVRINIVGDSIAAGAGSAVITLADGENYRKASLSDISVGDFVLTGGELPAAIIVDAVSRLIPGVLADSICFEDESIASGLLEYPQYTKPAEFMGLCVPDVLLRGNHSEISEWRRERALYETAVHRPDLIDGARLDKEDILMLEKINNSLS